MTDAPLPPQTAIAADPELNPDFNIGSDSEPTADPVIGKPHSLWSDAWQEMKRNPMFWISLVLIGFFVLMATVPQLFAWSDPHFCDLKNARQTPSAQHWFGTDIQGCDVYARTIYGARSSILVGVFTTIFTTVLGAFIGMVSAYLGGWMDAVLSRLGEIFFAIPLLLGSIVFLYSLPSDRNTPYILQVLKVVTAIAVLGWPSLARLMRSSVLQVMPQEYVQAARALGAKPMRIIMSHLLPNSVAPVIAVATINLGAYIALEATLSFLGIGLKAPIISWGLSISEASGLGYINSAPHMLLFPSLFLSLTVLAFIMLGEVVRDALDPKLR